MELRQEQIVALAAAAVLGLLAWRALPGDAPRDRSTGPSKDVAHYEAPIVELALRDSAAPEPPRTGGRSVFEPPRNTRPLPPLALEVPPRPVLSGLFPPPSPGPAPSHFGRFLRRDATPVPSMDLFLDTDEDGVFDFALTGAEEDDGGGGEGTSLEQQLRDMGFLQDEGSGLDEPQLTPEQRAALLESYKELYDWIEVQSSPWPLFGRIENADRYALKTEGSTGVPITFAQLVDWKTGEPPVSGTAPVDWPRSMVEGFGFARTFANEIELFLRELSGDVHPGNYAKVLAFADRCVKERFDAPRALEAGEELYRLLAAHDPDALRPRLGLTRCLEAGFRFEEAFELYAELSAAWPRRPEIPVMRGLLEERFLLTGAAEESFLEALRYDGSSWEANWTYGEFLLARGREEEAVQHLAKASQYAPTGPEHERERLLVRLSHGAALLRTGRTADAFKVFVQARKADASSQRALAGQIAAMLLEPTLAPTDGDALPRWLTDVTSDDRPEEGVRFDLLLAAGLWALEQRDFLLARDRLFDAARLDPLRASLAWRALSWLAEITGNPAEAWRFVEQALEADPTDAWTWFQLGRLLAQQDDLEGAEDAFQAALEIELDFADALAARGELAFAQGKHEDAERYLERALSLDERRADLLVLRGLNFLELGRVRDAESAFSAARDADPREPAAWNGLAWCEYRLGRPTESMVQLGEVQERFRNDADAAPDREWAERQVVRIRNHSEKEAWIDDFERTSLRNGWQSDERYGPTVSMVDGTVKVEGVFRDAGEARVWQTVKAALFVSFEASVWVSADSSVEAGLLVARERETGRGPDLLSGVSVSRHKDGTLLWSITRPGMPEDPIEVPWLDDFRADRWVRLRIERHGDPMQLGEAADDLVTISVDGTPIAENVKMPDLGRSQFDVKVGLFVRGEQARTAHVRLDDVEIVRRK
jgi:tetratricopeptide (TPR) repeat protein